MKENQIKNKVFATDMELNFSIFIGKVLNIHGNIDIKNLFYLFNTIVYSSINMYYEDFVFYMFAIY